MGNRIIKLQFWINDESRMIDSVGHCYESDTQIRIWYRNDGRLYNESFTVHNVSSRENCGHKDKNGVDVYEGDVVKWLNPQTGIEGLSEVRYNGRLARFQMIDGEVWYGINPPIQLEVLGNIYEHPHLISQPPQ